MKVTVPKLRSLKGERKITALTAYDYTFAKILNDAEIDLILVGDTLSAIVQGKPNTLSVTLDEVAYHSKHVAAACDYSLVVADLPFMTYQESNELAIRSAAHLMQTGQAEAVKIEGGTNIAERIQTLTKYDIPVVGHVGLTPQSYHQLGGHKRQGTDKAVKNSEQVLENALAVTEAGAFALVIECVPEELAQIITEQVPIPTIGIAAGNACDGQIAVTHDLLGLSAEWPQFIERQDGVRREIEAIISKFRK